MFTRTLIANRMDKAIASSGQRVLVLSNQVAQRDILAAAVLPGTLVLTSQEGASLSELLTEIESRIQGQPIQSLGVVTHGDLQGSSLFQKVSNPHSESADFWRVLSQQLDANSHIDLFGCQVAATSEETLRTLESLTHSTVAASIDDTGNVAHQGNWLLERGSRDLEALYFQSDLLNHFSELLQVTFICSDISYRYVLDITAADFNNDGKPDVVTVSPQQANQVCLGDGIGGFTCNDISIDAKGSRSITAADFNGDGNLDVAVANGSQANQVCLGDGAGEFTCNDIGIYTNTSFEIIAADFNGDGNLDVAVANGSQANQVCLGDGAGEFICNSISGRVKESYGLTAADFNGDGNLDVVLANYSQDNQVCLGDGAGEFTCNDIGMKYKRSLGITAADFNGDGKMDVAVVNNGQSNQVCLWGWPIPFYCNDISMETVISNGITAADFNGDGNLDVAIANTVGETNQVCLGNGVGEFTCNDISMDSRESHGIAIADFNSDGNLDVAIANYGQPSQVCLNISSASLTTSSSLSLSASPSTSLSLSPSASPSTSLSLSSSLSPLTSSSLSPSSSSSFSASLSLPEHITYSDSDTDTARRPILTTTIGLVVPVVGLVILAAFIAALIYRRYYRGGRREETREHELQPIESNVTSGCVITGGLGFVSSEPPADYALYPPASKSSYLDTHTFNNQAEGYGELPPQELFEEDEQGELLPSKDDEETGNLSAQKD